MPAISENLKLLRKAKHMTQEEVASIISVTRQTVSSYESGRTQPDLETLKRLAEVYQADLNDVLYGGNRLQRQLRRVRTAAIILLAVVMLGILTQSLLYLTKNTYYKMSPGTRITEENRAFIETGFALRDIGDTVARISTSVFGLGCIGMLYPVTTVVDKLKLWKIVLILLLSIVAMYACAIPFALFDKVYHIVDYTIPVSFWALPYTLLLFAVTLIAKLVKFLKQRKKLTNDT